MTTDELIMQREQTHGPFTYTAEIAQRTKALWRNTAGWNNLNDKQAEALDNIASKVARILSGNAADCDHWLDIGGYAKLGGS